MLGKSHNGRFYRVRVRKWQDEREHGPELKYKWHFHRDDATSYVSIEDIKFFAGPHSSDHYIEGVFRHHIGVPEGA